MPHDANDPRTCARAPSHRHCAKQLHHNGLRAKCMFCDVPIHRPHTQSGWWLRDTDDTSMPARAKRSRMVPPHARVDTTRDDTPNEER